jgi:hypothetical protein
MPFAIAAAVMAAGLAWTIHLTVSPQPWAFDAALALAIGTLVFSIVAMAALLLSRGRWTRYFATGLLIAELLIASVGDFEPWQIVAVTLSGLALAGLWGPWLQGWLRQRPAAGAPGWIPIAIAVGSFALVPLVGLASPSGLEPAHGALGAVGILLSWGYLRSGVWALHGLRFGLPILIVVASLSSPLGGAILLIAVGAGLSYLAWTKPGRLAVDPLPDLPAPRRKPR